MKWLFEPNKKSGFLNIIAWIQCFELIGKRVS